MHSVRSVKIQTTLRALANVTEDWGDASGRLLPLVLTFVKVLSDSIYKECGGSALHVTFVR